MEDLTRIQVITALSSIALPADAVAAFVNVVTGMAPPADAELAQMLTATPNIAKDFWFAAKDRMKAEPGLTVEQAVGDEVRRFQGAIDELM